MAFYLSDATHDRLRTREDGGAEPSLQEKGILLTHEFIGQMRCLEVASGSMPDFVIWSGDIDGEITIRKGLAGEPIGKIPRKKDAFVFCMARYGNYMWCGYSDGWINVYDVKTNKLEREIKAHCGAVNCMIVANDFIISGGNDWQIMQWDPVELCKRPYPHGQLSGHQNAVRCLTCDGPFLYSGGDDYAIRCWDLDTGYERGNPWPIVNHGDSVRTIAVSEVYLFSSSMDGTVKVWNTQTTQLVRELDSEPVPVNTLAVDNAGGRVWAGSTSGLIHVWDINTLNSIAVLNDHHETHVPLLRVMARVNAVKAWTIGADRKIRVWYSDNEANEIEFQELLEMEGSLQELVEAKRSEIIDNYRELERCKVRVKELEESDHNRKVVVAEVLANRNSATLNQASLHRNRVYWRKTVMSRFQQAAVERLETNSNSIIFRRYWQNLLANREKNKMTRRKVAVARFLQERQETNMTKVYLSNLQEHTRRTLAQKKREQVAEALSMTCSETSRRYAFLRWLQFFRRQQAAKKRAAFGALVARSTAENTMAIYWSKLLRYIRNERKREQKAQSVATMAFFYDRHLLMNYFHKLMNNVSRTGMQKQNGKTALALLNTSDRQTMADTYRKWALLVKGGQAQQAAENLQQQKDEIADLEKTLADASDVTEEQLEKELKEKQAELARVLAENEDLEDEMAEALARQKYLTREYAKDVTIRHDRPKVEQLTEAMHLLKGRGVSSFHDKDLIAKARDTAKTSSAETLYLGGVTAVRKLCTKLVKPEKMVEKGDPYWFTGTMFKSKKVTKKVIAKASEGICDMVTGFDMLNVGQIDAWLTTDKDGAEDWGAKYGHNEEVIANFGTFLEFATRQYRIRRKEDPLTGEPLPGTLGEKKKKKAGTKAGQKALNKKASNLASVKAAKKPAAKKSTSAGGAASKKTVSGQKPGVAKKKATGKKDGDASAPKKKKKSGTKKAGAKKTGTKKKGTKKKKKVAEGEEPAPEQPSEVGASPTAEATSAEASPSPANDQPTEAASSSENPPQQQDETNATAAPPTESTEEKPASASSEPTAGETQQEPEALATPQEGEESNATPKKGDEPVAALAEAEKKE